MPVPEASLRKLIAVLALIERPGGDGERNAAISAAGRILAADPAAWRQHLEGKAAPCAYHPPPPPPSPRDLTKWRPLAQECLANINSLNNWEIEFLTNILNSPWTTLTTKQEAALRKIITKLGL